MTSAFFLLRYQKIVIIQDILNLIEILLKGMRNKFRESNQIVQWISKTKYHFNDTRMLMSAVFQRNFLTKSQVQENVFVKCYCYITVLFNNKDLLLYYNVAVYTLVQSEEYFLIWIVKTLTTQTGKSKW